MSVSIPPCPHYTNGSEPFDSLYICVCTVYMYSIVDDAMLLLKWEAVKMKITRINMDIGESDPSLGGATRIHVILDFIWV